MWLLILLILVIVLALMVRRGAISVNTGCSNDSKNSKGRAVANAQPEYIPDSDDPFWLGECDTRFKNMQSQYYTLCEEIEADYTVLANAANPDAAAYSKVEKKCVDATALFQMLVPLWEKYDRGIPCSAPPYKRLAMIREKRGDYEGAALACVQQLRLGVQGDGTKGGMRGRLARMVKKGNLAETCPEAMKEITQYLEIKQ